jgi:hypothetical protein
MMGRSPLRAVLFGPGAWSRALALALADDAVPVPVSFAVRLRAAIRRHRPHVVVCQPSGLAHVLQIRDQDDDVCGVVVLAEALDKAAALLSDGADAVVLGKPGDAQVPAAIRLAAERLCQSPPNSRSAHVGQ